MVKTPLVYGTTHFIFVLKTPLLQVPESGGPGKFTEAVEPGKPGEPGESGLPRPHDPLALLPMLPRLSSRPRLLCTIGSKGALASQAPVRGTWRAWEVRGA